MAFLYTHAKATASLPRATLSRPNRTACSLRGTREEGDRSALVVESNDARFRRLQTDGLPYLKLLESTAKTIWRPRPWPAGTLRRCASENGLSAARTASNPCMSCRAREPGAVESDSQGLGSVESAEKKKKKKATFEILGRADRDPSRSNSPECRTLRKCVRVQSEAARASQPVARPTSRLS